MRMSHVVWAPPLPSYNKSVFVFDDLSSRFACGFVPFNRFFRLFVLFIT